MKFKMLTTVELRHDTAAGKFEPPTEGKAAVEPFASREKKTGNTAHYRLVSGHTYAWTDEKAERLIKSGHAEAVA